jgi:hypothetical protein
MRIILHSMEEIVIMGRIWSFEGWSVKFTLNAYRMVIVQGDE